MEQARLSILAILTAAFAGMIGSAEQTTVYRSLLEDLTSQATLASLAAGEVDWRGCDRDWNKVNDFWTADVAGLYTRASAAVAASADSEDP